MSAKILVATHKSYNFPQSQLYVPIHVGKVLSQNDFGYLGDDTKDNISDKNRSFCELTALYWAWKNNYFKENEFCGLVHYRRYFSGDQPFQNSSILSKEFIIEKLSTYDVIVPYKRRYYIETLRSHYAHAHYEHDLDSLETILFDMYPEYKDSFQKVMNQNSLYLFNMFVMRREKFNNYCAWLFSILFELERRIDISKYGNYQSRVFGFLAERLFNVWLVYNELKLLELKVVHFEGENIVEKVFNLLKRKIYPEKYKNI